MPWAERNQWPPGGPRELRRSSHVRRDLIDLRPLCRTLAPDPAWGALCIEIGFDLADTTAYAMSHGVISMLNVRRASSVSIDPSGRRSSIRERWIPTAPGDGDLRSRSYPLAATMFFEEGTLRDVDDVGVDAAAVRRIK